jgi:thiol-disulfide isomerase/thioredoxin
MLFNETFALCKKNACTLLAMCSLGLATQWNLHSTALAAAGSARFSCPPLNREQLQKKLAEHGPLKMVFFSTWCSDCSKHIQALAKEPKEKHVAVATFDTQKKVENTLRALSLEIECVMDDGLASEMGVKVVPAERLLSWEKSN